MPKIAAIGDIIGGEKALEREIGDPINIIHIYDTWRLYSGFKAIVQLGVKAIWSNGINNDTILPDRLIELKDLNEWMDAYGYAIVIIDGSRNPPTADAWHPEINGIGFTFIEFSPFGDPLKIRIKMKTEETDHDKHNLEIPAYPCELDSRGERILTKPIPGEFGFFNVRTRGGLKGVQGLPKYLDLIDPIRAQMDILKAYIPYAEKQGLAHPAVWLKDPSPTNRAQVKSDFSKQPQKDRLVIISMEDDIDYKSPQQNSWDPTFILEWIDKMISRATQMSKLMLEGMGGGLLATSESSISNWEADIKETQVYHRTQFLPIWIALGADEDTNFKDPSKPAFLSLMEGVKMIREGLFGLVANEDIVKLMNERLELEGDEMLTVASDEELAKTNGGDEDGSGGSDEGNKSDKTKTD